jgi:apolipoprotein N-acyltransferase
MALEGNPEFRQALTDIARQTGAWILLGAPSFRGDGGDRRYYNSVYLIDPSGNIAGRYDKIYLLPFAERRFALLELMSEHDSGLYTRGENITPLVMGGPGGEGGAGVPIGAFICYEAGIPSLAGSLARRGARFFANISNDAWFGESAESLQQIAMLQVRCAEFGVPAVRSSGWGVAAVVDRRGRVVSSTDIGGETSLRAEISVSAGGLSPYARFQGWFEIACALLLLGAFYRRGRNTVDEKPREG